MQVQKIQDQQAFNGRAYALVEGSEKIIAKTAVGQINSMKAMKEADYDIFLCPAQFGNAFELITSREKERLNSFSLRRKIVPQRVTPIVDAAKKLLQESSPYVPTPKVSIGKKIAKYISTKFENFMEYVDDICCLLF